MDSGEDYEEKVAFYLKTTSIKNCDDYLGLFKLEETLIVGKVLDIEETPVLNAKIELFDNGGKKIKDRKTFSDGNFVLSFDKKDLSSIKIKISHADYEDQEFITSVREDRINVPYITPLHKK